MLCTFLHNNLFSREREREIVSTADKASHLSSGPLVNTHPYICRMCMCEPHLIRLLSLVICARMTLCNVWDEEFSHESAFSIEHVHTRSYVSRLAEHTHTLMVSVIHSDIITRLIASRRSRGGLLPSLFALGLYSAHFCCIRQFGSGFPFVVVVCRGRCATGGRHD